MYAQILYEALLTYDAPFDPEKGVVLVPNLAKDWSFSDDGSLLTLNLREGITWHDGTPFTSADVAGDVQPVPGPGVHGVGRVGQQVQGPGAERAGG